MAELATKLRERRVSASPRPPSIFWPAPSPPATWAPTWPLDEEVTLAQARARRMPASPRAPHGPLEGVPIAHKDIFVTKDFPTTAGSKMLTGYRSAV